MTDLLVCGNPHVGIGMSLQVNRLVRRSRLTGGLPPEILIFYLSPPAEILMPDRHEHGAKQVRAVPREEADAFDAAAAAVGSNRSHVTRELWAWFSGKPGAELPERPASQW